VLFCEVREDPRKRRDRLEIIAEILKAARVGIQKTLIMYQAGLSFALLTEYLSFLVRLGLLEARNENERLVYKTTPKGKRYVKRYEEIKHLLQKNTEHSVTDFSPPSPFPERSA
jgi:predicted transcriptional regulator